MYSIWYTGEENIETVNQNYGDVIYIKVSIISSIDIHRYYLQSKNLILKTI